MQIFRSLLKDNFCHGLVVHCAKYSQSATHVLPASCISCKICKRTVSNTSLLRNHYETLGIKQSASSEEIKTAFIELSKKYHPDKTVNNGPKLETAQHFLKIREAYEVLNNQKTKAEYDFNQFGRSSDINRFSSGEYELHQKNPYDFIKSSIHQKESNPPLISPRIKNLLSKLYAFILVTGVTMYILGRYNRKEKVKSEIPD